VNERQHAVDLIILTQLCRSIRSLAHIEALDRHHVHLLAYDRVPQAFRLGVGEMDPAHPEFLRSPVPADPAHGHDEQDEEPGDNDAVRPLDDISQRRIAKDQNHSPADPYRE